MLDFILKLLGLCKSEAKIEIKEEPKMLTVDQLYKINGNMCKDKCEYYIDALNSLLPKYDINTPLRISHFLAQILHESCHLKHNKENLNYSACALRSVFCKYFKTDEEANAYARQPERIANRVYANRMGNGNEASGDGWKYAGKGLIQLTGKANYAECSTSLGLDLISCPEAIITSPDVCVETACWFWNKHNLNLLADKDDITAITKKINGGLNGIDDRKKLLASAKSILL